jgi:hypothetical protein
VSWTPVNGGNQAPDGATGYCLGVNILVEVGGWEHECCGAALERRSEVTLTCISPDERSDGRYLVYSAHGIKSPAYRCTGHVLDLWLVDEAGHQQPIQRVPSGPALRGFDESDDGAIRSEPTGEIIAAHGGRFLVRLGSVSIDEIN